MRRLLLVAVAAAACVAAAPANAAPACKDVASAAGMTFGYCLPGFTCTDLCTWHNGDVYCHRTPAKATVAVDVCSLV
jgi:hypothetical protein